MKSREYEDARRAVTMAAGHSAQRWKDMSRDERRAEQRQQALDRKAENLRVHALVKKYAAAARKAKARAPEGVAQQPRQEQFQQQQQQQLQPRGLRAFIANVAFGKLLSKRGGPG